MSNYSDTQIEVIYRSWWSASFPGAPPGLHAIRTHVAFGQFLLEQVQQQEQREVGRD